MKTLALVLLAVCLIAAPAFAETTTKAVYSVPSSQGFEDFLNDQNYLTHNHSYNMENYLEKDDLVLGAKVDMPLLLRITEALSLGIEASKNCVQTNMKEGYEGYVKLTYTGTLLDLRKKK